MSTQAIEISKTQSIQQWKSPEQVKARIQAIQSLMRTALTEGVDYGIIPGMPKGTKPSLWKSGSEQILSMFSIAVEPIVEDLSTDDCFRYRVTTRLTNSVTGDFLGSGIGEASSDETKYKWKRTYNQKEFDHTPADRKRIKFSQRHDNGKWVDFEEMQVRQEPADVANTILKMSKKRSQIDGTLTVTGASGIFGQDLDEDSEEASETRRSRGKKPQQVKETGDVICASCGGKNGHTPECKYRQQCPECHAPTGKPHASGCSQEGKSEEATEEKKTEPKELKWLVQVEAVDERPRMVTDKKTGEKKQNGIFLLLTGFNAATEPVTLYCWHTGETASRIKAIKPKTKCIFMVAPKPQGDKMYYQIESIVEITGEQIQQQGELIPPDEQ